MFKKILVANRGEIASRIIRACKELGIQSVAIYSEEDSTALYIRKADEAYLVGPGPIEGFLNPYLIIDIAQRVGADAIHPGYGFLAENVTFVKECESHNIKFIGPSSESMAKLSNKLEAKKLAKNLGIPLLPFTEKEVLTVEEAKEEAKKITYPVILKAAGGGGGRGMRIVKNPSEMAKQFQIAKMEAENFFADPRIFIEKYIEKPHHIEIQVLSDSYGNVIHLGERDCSIQRRHQKIIEIAPSLILTEKKRNEMADCAIKLVKEANYENACTVEFLVDDKLNFFFMEANTRLQVEHSVTEEITGFDIVQEQIRIAEGEKLSVKQSEICFTGYAIQSRINAEDPKNGFLPDSGRITAYYSPGGIGVRIDGAIYKDYVVPEFYDSLLAKLTVRGRTWKEAVARMHRSLGEYIIRGIKTTLPFLMEIAKHPDFVSGNFNTSFIESHPELFEYTNEPLPEDIVAAISAAIGFHEGL